jgi:RNA polymerase sigma-70 factor (ECF subfamily)
LIYNTAISSELSDAEAQDVVQETLICVMKSMREFQYDPKKASFKSWLLRLTKWRITDQVRKRQRGIEDSPSLQPDETSTLESIPAVEDPELQAVWDKEWERNLIAAAIERVKKKVDPKHYQIFDLYVLKHWTVSGIAKTLGVNRGLIYLTKHRINHLIKKEISCLRVKLA